MTDMTDMTDKPDYSRIVRLAYLEILDREPDPGGLQFYREQMASGWTEAGVREALLRSPEYLEKWHFPDEAPPPEPPPTPVPGGKTRPLQAAGSFFVDDTGAVVKLQGSIICCADADADGPGTLEMGWPLVNEIALDLFTSYHLNFTHIRLGPHCVKTLENPEGEPNAVNGYQITGGGLYDLDQWNDAFWSRVRAILAYAAARGIYVEVDLIDNWVLDHELGPWSVSRNIQGFGGGTLGIKAVAPTPRHETWIRKAVRETGGFDCVLYQDGNESFKGPQTGTWARGLRDIVLSELNVNGYPRRPIGSNSQRPEINQFFHYEEWHERDAQPANPARPVMTNEYADISPSYVLSQVRAANKAGTSFHYWRGGHNTKDYHATLAALLSPPAIPAECPALVRWTSKIFNVMNRAFQQIDSPERDGYVVVDSTPRFGQPGTRGLPCNSEHDNCGGRQCEDPRGGVWTLEEGSAPLHLQSNNYQCRVGPLSPGHYRLRVSPLPDAKDGEEGKPLKIVGDVSTTTEWEVP